MKNRAPSGDLRCERSFELAEIRLKGHVSRLCWYPGVLAPEIILVNVQNRISRSELDLDQSHSLAEERD